MQPVFLQTYSQEDYTRTVELSWMPYKQVWYDHFATGEDASLVAQQELPPAHVAAARAAEARLNAAKTGGPSRQGSRDT